MIFENNPATMLVTVLLSLVTVSVDALPRVDPLVETNVGLIRGLQATNGDYAMFLGIPFGQLDENNPFGLSKPVPKFDKIFEAVNDTNICPQLEIFNNTIVGTPHCLQLNVYVPNSATSTNKLPVLVWIYGGSFYRGFASKDVFGPKYLVKHDVILVAINYRVGAYGFMCLDTPEVPGNQGLKDQLLALRWIKSNIGAFGGDADKITLFGQSAGGRSVDFHLVSEQEKLFDKVIMQSGNSICPPAIGLVDTRAPLMLAEKLGLLTDDVAEAMAFLSKAEPKAVVAASLEIDYRFRPCVENDYENVEKFVTDYTFNKVIPKVKTTPILAGHHDNELILSYENKDDSFFENLDLFNESLAKYFDFNDEQLSDMVQIVKQYYLGDENMSKENRQAIADFDSDFTYLHPTYRRSYQNVMNGAKTVYHYVYSYKGPRNFSAKEKNVTIIGTAHCDEQGYLFDMKEHFDYDPTEEDLVMIDKMTTMWTNFAKYGDPTPNVSELLPIRWKPITKTNLYYYKIDKEITLESRPINKRMAFWDLFFKYNWQLQKGYHD